MSDSRESWSIGHAIGEIEDLEIKLAAVKVELKETKVKLEKSGKDYGQLFLTLRKREKDCHEHTQDHVVTIKKWKAEEKRLNYMINRLNEYDLGYTRSKIDEAIEAKRTGGSK